MLSGAGGLAKPPESRPVLDCVECAGRCFNFPNWEHSGQMLPTWKVCSSKLCNAVPERMLSESHRHLEQISPSLTEKKAKDCAGGG
jgi:hypothetical protein